MLGKRAALYKSGSHPMFEELIVNQNKLIIKGMKVGDYLYWDFEGDRLRCHLSKVASWVGKLDKWTIKGS